VRPTSTSTPALPLELQRCVRAAHRCPLCPAGHSEFIRAPDQHIDARSAQRATPNSYAPPISTSTPALSRANAWLVSTNTAGRSLLEVHSEIHTRSRSAHRRPLCPGPLRFHTRLRISTSTPALPSGSLGIHTCARSAHRARSAQRVTRNSYVRSISTSSPLCPAGHSAAGSGFQPVVDVGLMGPNLLADLLRQIRR
jgi:hypothetical protein